MTNEDELDDIVRQKDFAELNEEERALVIRTIGSEEEYQAIRKIERIVSDRKFRSTLEPKSETLRALQERMKKNPASFEWQSIFQAKVPAYVALLGVVVVAALILIMRPAVPAEPISLEKTSFSSPRIDTIFVTKIDTVVRERIVYRKFNQVNLVSPPVTLDPATLVHVKEVPGSGVSMKEKEELNKLLVSGSD